MDPGDPIKLLTTPCQVGGEGNGTPLQYSCLENLMDRGAWKAAVHGVTEGRLLPTIFPSIKVFSNESALPSLLLLLSRFSCVRPCVTP